MAAATLESRPLYGIGTVARLTRVRPETLRIWERRYGLGASQKADNGRRLYTQTDLEHLQIVARLVEEGFRIGEIAAMERKTLQALLEQAGVPDSGAPTRPRALVIGSGLCSWLDQHPGCLTSLDARLLRAAPESVAPETLGDLGRVDLLITECGALGDEQVRLLQSLREALSPLALLVFYEFSHQRVVSDLEAEGVHLSKLPLDTGNFAGQIRKLTSRLEVERGVADTGDLVALRERLFSESELARQLQLESPLACGCTRHLADIIGSLANFEDYSRNCSVENWQDAATHTCVHAYTNQARWLMEKALQAVLEEHASHSEQAEAAPS